MSKEIKLLGQLAESKVHFMRSISIIRNFTVANNVNLQKCDPLAYAQLDEIVADLIFAIDHINYILEEFKDQNDAKY